MMDVSNELPWTKSVTTGNWPGAEEFITYELSARQARAGFEGAKAILEIESMMFPLQQWREGMDNPHWVTWRKAIEKLRQFVGEK